MIEHGLLSFVLCDCLYSSVCYFHYSIFINSGQVISPYGFASSLLLLAPLLPSIFIHICKLLKKNFSCSKKFVDLDESAVITEEKKGDKKRLKNNIDVILYHMKNTIQVRDRHNSIRSENNWWKNLFFSYFKGVGVYI